MLHGERYVYCIEQDRKNNKVEINTYIKAWYGAKKAPSYKSISELGYYTLTVRQVRYKIGSKRLEKASDRRLEIRVPACELEALLKDAKLSYEDKELL